VEIVDVAELLIEAVEAGSEKAGSAEAGS